MAVLDRVICFSVGFCDNSLVLLKMRFHVIPVNFVVVKAFSSAKPCLSFFKI